MIVFNKISDSHYNVMWQYFGDKSETKDGELLKDVDGYFYYWPEIKYGCLPACILRQIADKLDELNKDWHEQVITDTTIS